MRNNNPKQPKRVVIASLIALAVASCPSLAVKIDIQPSNHYKKIEPYLPPGFQSEMTIDPKLGEMYDIIKYRRWREDDIYEVLVGRNYSQFHLGYSQEQKQQTVIQGLLPAMICDGGYAFLGAYFVKKYSTRFRNARNPTNMIGLKKFDDRSPSMTSLVLGMHDFMIGEYISSEKELINSIFINVYGKEIGIQKAIDYLKEDNLNTRKDLLKEVENLISSMKYSHEEFMKCDPSTESTRLMLAQWGAYFLSTVYEIRVAVGKPWKRKDSRQNQINILESAFWKVEFPLFKKIGTYIRGPKEYFEPIPYEIKRKS